MLDKIEENPDYAIELPAQQLTRDHIESQCQDMKLRINARCKDLLQVTRKTYRNSMLNDNLDSNLWSKELSNGKPSLQPPFPYEVDFLHRTVKDFFRVNDIQTFVATVLSAGLVASYEAHGSGATRPSHIECTQLLSSVVHRCPKVFLVVDAFDEYPEERRGPFLAELQRLQPNISTMITSRDLPNIETQLSKAIRLNVQAKSDDILQYLRGQIASSGRLKPHTDRDPTLCDLISTTIAARAGGM